MKLENAILDKITTLKDKSLKVTLITREMTPEQTAKLFAHLNQEIATIDVPNEVGETKSPSQRLRAVIYKIWETQNIDFKTKYENSFELYYKSYMEKIINSLKDKI